MGKNKSLKNVPPPAPPPWVLPTPAVGIGLLVWTMVVYVQYFDKERIASDYLLWVLDQIPGLSLFHAYTGKALAAVGITALIGWVALQLGMWILNRLLQEPLEGWARPTLGCALGFGALSLAVIVLGSARLWYPSVFWALLLLPAAFFAWKRQPLWVGPPTSHESIPWYRVWWLLLFAMLGLIAIGDLTPETFYDSLYYHIAVPNLYRLAHRIYDIPTMLFSNFILTIQLLFGIPLTIGSAVAAKALHGLMAGLLLTGFLAVGQRFLTPGAGLIGAVLFFAMPLVGTNAMETGVDVGWSFLHIASTYALLTATLEPTRRRLILAGVLTGLSASCKYPGFPFIPIAAIIFVWYRRFDKQDPWNVVIRDTLIFLVAASVFILPILIRNTLFHENPLYPFGGTRFGIPRISPRHWDIFVVDANTRFLKQEFASVEAFFRYLFHPWHIAMEGGSNADFMGPLYLLFAPLLFLFKAPTPAFRLLRRYAGILYLLWMLTSRTPRYGMPGLALIALLLGEAIVFGFQRSGWRPAVFVAIVIGAFTNITAYASILFSHEGWLVQGGRLSESEFLGEMHGAYPTPPYTGVEWMNKNLPKNSVILYAGEARTHYTELMSIPSSVPDPQPLLVYAETSRDGAEMASKMRRDGITHIYLNFAEAARTEGYGLFPFDARSWPPFEDFWKRYVRQVWSVERFERGNPKIQYVWELVSDADANVPHPAPSNPFERWKPKSTGTETKN